MEELTCVEAAGFLLNDEDGDLLPDPEAIFGEEVITDGDTRGCMKFKAKQTEIISEAANNKGKYIPGIVHFVKCISNGFYKQTNENKECSGVGLLDLQRIRYILSDISRDLRDFCYIQVNIIS